MWAPHAIQIAPMYYPSTQILVGSHKQNLMWGSSYFRTWAPKFSCLVNSNQEIWLRFGVDARIYRFERNMIELWILLYASITFMISLNLVVVWRFNKNSELIATMITFFLDWWSSIAHSSKIQTSRPLTTKNFSHCHKSLLTLTQTQPT